ncbi:helix-turn-helix domain-containing protein, partial [Burkholderia gladioli]
MTNNTTELTADEVIALLAFASRIEDAEESPIPVGVHAALVIRKAIALLTSPRAAGPGPAGWKMVPIERSYNMRAKALIAFNTTEKKTNDRDDALDAAHRAMLDAAPAAPVAVLSDGDAANLITIDRRDLYGFVRGSIKRALEDASHGAAESHEPMSAVECWSEAHTRTIEIFDSMKIAGIGEPVAEAVCSTCNGHGMIGGPSFYAPDEGGAPCPDCAEPVAQAEPVGIVRRPAFNGQDFSVEWLRPPAAGALYEGIAKVAPAAQAVAADGAAAEDVLETIDLKAEAGLCAMSLSGARAFLKDIREIVKTARAAVSPATADTTWKAPKQHCQNGGDVCLAGNRDGVCCPEDSCDIDDGTRKNPATAGERAAFVEKLRELGADISPLGSRDERLCITSNIMVDDVLAAARASQAAAPASKTLSCMQDEIAGVMQQAAAPALVPPFKRYNWDGKESEAGPLVFFLDVLEALKIVEDEQAAAPAEAREPLVMWQDGTGMLWDTYSHGKWMHRFVSPHGWDAHAVAQHLYGKGYAGHLEVRAVCSGNYVVPADAGEAVSIENPLTPYGMLVRALRIVAGTTLMEMATGMGVSPAFLSSLEFGRRPVTYDNAAFASGFFSDKGIVDTLPALAHAVGLSQGAQGGKGGEA